MPSANASTNFETMRGSSRRDFSETATILRRYGTSRGVRSTINLKPSLAAMVAYGGSRTAGGDSVVHQSLEASRFAADVEGNDLLSRQAQLFQTQQQTGIGHSREACDRNGFALEVGGRFDRRMNDEGQVQSASRRHDHFHRKSA